MRDIELRTFVGIFWVATQFLTLIVIVTCFFLHGFEFDEFTTLLSIVIPMFAGVTTMIVKYFAKHRHSVARGRSLSSGYVILTWLLPSVFSILVIVTIIARATNRAFDNFEQAKLFLTTLESVYVGYIGYLFAPLFEGLSKAPAKAEKGVEHEQSRSHGDSSQP
jgi:Na+/H+-translocating membrane pyrophosphatase